MHTYICMRLAKISQPPKKNKRLTHATHLLHPVELPDVVERVDGRGEAPVEAEDLCVVCDGGRGGGGKGRVGQSVCLRGRIEGASRKRRTLHETVYIKQKCERVIMVMRPLSSPQDDGGADGHPKTHSVAFPLPRFPLRRHLVR